MASVKDDDEVGPVPDGKEVFIVERVLNHRYVDDQLEYLLQWKGFPAADDTWEPHKNLYCVDLIKEYEDWRGKSLRQLEPGKVLPNRPRKKEDKKEVKKKPEVKVKPVKVTADSAWDLRRRAVRIISATDSGGELAFLVAFQDWPHLELVPAREMNQRFPKVVIAYYEQLPSLKWENVTGTGSAN